MLASGLRISWLTKLRKVSICRFASCSARAWARASSSLAQQAFALHHQGNQLCCCPGEGDLLFCEDMGELVRIKDDHPYKLPAPLHGCYDRLPNVKEFSKFSIWRNRGVEYQRLSGYQACHVCQIGRSVGPVSDHPMQAFFLF